MLKKVILALAVMGLLGTAVGTASARGYGRGGYCYRPTYHHHHYRPHYGYGGYGAFYAYRGSFPYLTPPYAYPPYGGYGYGSGLSVTFGF